ncbi:uncharacterized protein TA21005 [Theileria annulata]|uniref:Uncharacterized protein n=1 Tax=Theileria annulata TaxID=5874 RepID=Q4UGV5_THEAN|nr:uncharacterized protein TA21005 [Theileria annulata]CAI73684.1 hypothetical protein TA21005 [Theileria annulata]|eukprot:XP_954361.1 hypothetical protein TA21005 [Theileria annulata]
MRSKDNNELTIGVVSLIFLLFETLIIDFVYNLHLFQLVIYQLILFNCHLAMGILTIFLFLFIQAISGMKTAGNTCRLPSLNNAMSRCVQTLKNISNNLLTMNKHTIHNFNVRKTFDFGNHVFNLNLMSTDDIIKPVMYSNEDTLDPNVKPKYTNNYVDFNELSVNYTAKIDNITTCTSNVVIDLPRTLQLTLKGLNGEIKAVDVSTSDVLKRLDFILRYRNSLVGTSFNLRSREKSVELVQRLEEVYKLSGKSIDLIPKLEVALDKNNKMSTRACLVIKRDKLTFTPIVHLNQRKCEIAAEANLTNEVKFSMFLSKDNHLYMSLSYDSNWGKHSWQQLSLRFVLSDVLKCYSYLQNEIRF